MKDPHFEIFIWPDLSESKDLMSSEGGFGERTGVCRRQRCNRAQAHGGSRNQLFSTILDDLILWSAVEAPERARRHEQA
jgi:hypothetical protein